MIDGKPCINVKDPLEISYIEPEPYIIEEELKDAINTAIDTLLVNGR